MSTHGDGGKGSGRRKEDASKVRDNWDLIFGAKVRSKTMDEYKCETEHPDDDDYEDDDTCTWCGGCGEGDHDGASCRKCHGTGVEPYDGVDDDYV